MPLTDQAQAQQAYGRQWGKSYGTRDWNRLYHYPYVYYPQNFWSSEYYKSSNDLYNRYPPEMRDTIRALPKKVPLGRLGTESEVSAAIVFLLSPAAAFISGSWIRIDGAVPNVKSSYPLAGRGTTTAFDGFHLAVKPEVLG